MAARRVRTVPLIADLTVPTLLAVGRHDPQTPVRISEDAHALARDSVLEVFKHSGHSPHVEEPDRFAAMLREFLLADSG